MIKLPSKLLSFEEFFLFLKDNLKPEYHPYESHDSAIVQLLSNYEKRLKSQVDYDKAIEYLRILVPYGREIEDCIKFNAPLSYYIGTEVTESFWRTVIPFHFKDPILI